MKRMSVAELKAANARRLWHPMAHAGAARKTPPDIIARAEGSWIWDIDGHKMIDGVGGLWANNIGCGRAEIHAAIIEQLQELSFFNIFSGATHPRAIELAERLVGMMQPDGVDAVFFSGGGSDAVETALKLARQYWKVKGEADRTKYISLKQGYHGVHFGGMSVNGNTRFRRNYEPLLPGCFHIDTPWLYRNPYTDDPTRLGELCANLLERELLFQGPDTVAAFIAEPVQGAGGVIVPPPNYWPLIREICDRYGVLLIADEVVTGFGRTGHLFGTRLWGVQADLWCFAKGISSGYVPLGATAISSKVAQVFSEGDASLAAVNHGTTYSAHPLAAAAALATLDVLERDNVVANAADQGSYFQQRLRAMGSRFRLIGDVRGIGLMAAIELVSDRSTKEASPSSAKALGREAYKRGAMVRTSGANIILSPALTITREEVDVLCDVLEAALAAIEVHL